MADRPFGELEVHDGFLDVAEKGIQRLFQGQAWSFGWKSNARSDTHSFWHRHFIENSPRARAEDRDRYTAERFPVVQDIWERVLDKVSPEKGRPVLQRAYANGLTFGLEGRIHTDSSNPRDATALIYVNPFWVPAWAGETVFLDGKGRSSCVAPVPGRLVLFNGTTQHVARAPSRDCPALRITLMFKFRMEASP